MLAGQELKNDARLVKQEQLVDGSIIMVASCPHPNIYTRPAAAQPGEPEVVHPATQLSNSVSLPFFITRCLGSSARVFLPAEVNWGGKGGCAPCWEFCRHHFHSTSTEALRMYLGMNKHQILHRFLAIDSVFTSTRMRARFLV